MPASAPRGSPLTTWPLAKPSTAPTDVRSSAPCRRPAGIVCRTPKVYQMKSPRVAAAATTSTPKITFIERPAALYAGPGRGGRIPGRLGFAGKHGVLAAQRHRGQPILQTAQVLMQALREVQEVPRFDDSRAGGGHQARRPPGH